MYVIPNIPQWSEFTPGKLHRTIRNEKQCCRKKMLKLKITSENNKIFGRNKNIQYLNI